MNLAAHSNLCAYCSQPSPGGKYCCAGCRTMASLPGLTSQENGDEGLPPLEFRHLDQENFRALFRQESSPNSFVFYAEGMHCSSCVHLLENLPRYCSSVLSARVHFANSSVAIVLHPEGSLAEAANAVKALGYKPSLLAPTEASTLHTKEESRRSLRRIAVAGFCAGNMMLFVIPIYAGLDGALRDIFNWISFLLFLPVLLYSARPCFRGALTSLKYRVVSVDLPIAVALSAGFVCSTFNLVRGDGAIYFDSTASFLFLILCARHLLKTVQQNHLATANLQTGLNLDKFTRVSLSGTTEIVPFADLQVNDTLILTRGQTLPAESKLLSLTALVDLSLMNGESLPKSFTQNMILLGGTKILNDTVTVQLVKSFEDSKIGQLCKHLESGATAKNNFTTLTDSLAQKLILGVIATAAIFFAMYSFVDISAAFNRALALIVLACPCALAFGAPLTYGFALRRAVRRGIFIKDPNTFEKILELKHVFFDKTGTLTEGHLALTHSEPGELSPQLKHLALSLENHSYHAIAFALRGAWSTNEPLAEVSDFKEVLGTGVQGIMAGNLYEMRTLSESIHENEVAVEILENREPVARIYFSDKLREDSSAVVAELKARGLKCSILSGDRNVRCQQIGALCGIPAENIHGELFPEEKYDFIEKESHTCMLGDGANDSLALKAAEVGIAVKGSVDLSLTHADVYFTHGGLSPLLELLKISKTTRKILKRNLTISLVYNLVGGILALAGFINPMMAAILMPISSMAIILSSLWGFR